jgi:hypothetical protein
MDPISVGLVASAAVRVLGPYLGDLAKKAADGIVDKAADSATSGAFKAATSLLDLVRKKFRGKGEAEKSLDALAAAPEDPAAQAAVEQTLKHELEHDAEFTAALSRQLTQVADTKADVAFVNNIQGDVGKIAQFHGPIYGDVSF